MNARTPLIGKELAMLKAASGHRAQRDMHNFRLARIGPGWVVGDMEGSASLRNPGLYVAGKSNLYYIYSGKKIIKCFLFANRLTYLLL